MLEAARDATFGRTLLNGVFKDGMFPGKLSDAAAAHHWVAIYQVHSGSPSWCFCDPKALSDTLPGKWCGHKRLRLPLGLR